MSTLGSNGNTKRVCVIGAGVSGLPSIKACLEEGLDVVCYERTADLGGLWNYRSLNENHSTVMKSTVVNTSKEMMAYSDYPPPAEYPNFMHNSLVNKYLHAYATNFNLNKHIVYNTNVDVVTPTADHESSGRWRVRLSNGDEEIFDFVMICTGHHAMPIMPKFEGLERFKGKVMHSQSLHDTAGLENKDVLIIGIGNSAMDAATAFAGISKSVTLSTRRGTWVWQKVARNGVPFDILYITRFWRCASKLFGRQLTNAFLERLCNRRCDHELYGLRPEHHFDAAHPTLNDVLPNLLCSGQVVVKGDVKSFTEDSVIFEDDTSSKTDLVILATGYTYAYSFMQPQSLIPITDNEIDAYKYIFPLHLQKQSVAIIGLIQPIGSISPISELQARWVARVFSGRCQLPSIENQFVDVELKRAQMRERYVKSQRHTVQVDYFYYMDEIAELLGCDVSIIREFFCTSPRFAFNMFFGPYYPYYFRLRGPHAWSGARACIENAAERVRKPLCQRAVDKNPYKDWPLLRRVHFQFTVNLLIILLCVTLGVSYALLNHYSETHSLLGFMTTSCTAFAISGIIMVLLGFWYDIALIT